MPIPANRAKIQLARGNYSNLIASVTEFAEGELSYAKDENLLYIKEEGELIRLEYVTRADLDAAVEESIDLEVYGGDGLLTENGTTGSSPTTTLSLDLDYLREKTGIADSREPSGFINKDDTVIAYRPAEEEIWFYPVGASAAVWCQGVKYTFSTYKAVPRPSVTGLYYIYLDDEFELQIKSTPFDYRNETPVCQLYWDEVNAKAVLLLDRRHGIAMDWSTQEFLESSLSSIVRSGFNIAGIAENPDGSSDTQAKFTLGNGTAMFQDLKISVTHNATPAGNVASNLFQQVLSPAAKVPVFYLSGTSWTYDNPTEYGYITDTGVPAFNKYTTTWGKQQVANNKHFISYVFATQNTQYPIIAIPGQEEYGDLSTAESTNITDLDLDKFKDVQLRLLYKIIYRYDPTYTNTTKTVIVGYQDLRSYGGGTSGNTVTDHGRLGGLLDDDHAQYVHVSVDRVITANHDFAGALRVSNTTESTTATNGALVVEGGVGINGNLNVNGDIGAILDGGNF
jgi:hypothetical protein